MTNHDQRGSLARAARPERVKTSPSSGLATKLDETRVKCGRRKGTMGGSRIRDERGVALVEFALVLPCCSCSSSGCSSSARRSTTGWTRTTSRTRASALRSSTRIRARLPVRRCRPWVKAQGDTNEFRNGGTSSVPTAAQVTICFPDGVTESDSGDAIRVKVAVGYNLIPFISNTARHRSGAARRHGNAADRACCEGAPHSCVCG